MTHFKQALAEWQHLLGVDCVALDPITLESAETASFYTDQKISAILTPLSVEQVQNCLEIANRYQIAIYPTSRGRNCGYGSKVPYDSGSVLLDLQKLNQISDYDQEMACVRVQAGVTQEQLSTYLKNQGAKLWMDPISSFADCSVLANILERGHGMTPHADRISFATDFEVVLPDGELLQTGFSAFANSRTKGLDRWAPGPQLDGLFSQSNLGIVTSLTLWLMPAPECVLALGFAIDTQENFVKIIDALRPLRIDGTLKWGPRFFNEYRLIETYSKYPWDLMKDQTPLSQQCAEKLQADLQIPLWTGLVGFYGSAENVRANQNRVRKALQDLAKNIVILDRGNLEKSAGSHATPQNPQTTYEKFLWANFRAMQGEVQPVTQRPRWRKKNASLGATQDWSLDRCGIIWCPVLVPFRGKETLEAVQLFRQMTAQFKLEPDMSVSAIRDRSLEINASLVFDREDPKQEMQALNCAKEYLSQSIAAGFYPHRVGLATSECVFGQATTVSRLLSKMKAFLDPNQILAPGKLR